MADPRHAFVFADLSGYTALTEAHGDETAADIVELFCQHACERLAVHGAERIKGIGDALMLRCDEAGQGLALGVELVSASACAARYERHRGPPTPVTPT